MSARFLWELLPSRGTRRGGWEGAVRPACLRGSTGKAVIVLFESCFLPEFVLWTHAINRQRGLFACRLSVKFHLTYSKIQVLQACEFTIVITSL